MSARHLVALVVGSLVLGACGSDDTGVSPSAARVLDSQVDAIRITAIRADRDTVTDHVVLLRASVDQLHGQGKLSDAAATRIRRSVAEVESQLVLLPTTTTTTTTTTTAPPPPDPDRDRDRGHGRWKDKNRDDDDGDES
jgi:hypothetical protein